MSASPTARSVSSPSAAGREWASIDTAPRDGSQLVGLYWDGAYERKGDLVRIWWQPEFDAFISSARMMQMHNGYTFGDGSTEHLHSPVIETPSHWMAFEPPADRRNEDRTENDKATEDGQ